MMSLAIVAFEMTACYVKHPGIRSWRLSGTSGILKFLTWSACMQGEPNEQFACCRRTSTCHWLRLGPLLYFHGCSQTRALHPELRP
ncbi:hypothetical protein A0H81_00521 [Grifola frondosa]|uniref:Uncharacterized protein n=1 Tax=Grifola frondosa TaxID=5627 RepID=A0A1C7MSB7_GRIFR|nr:hypothetical protein A0H81_00521 [Grifola frondosa]